LVRRILICAGLMSFGSGLAAAEVSGLYRVDLVMQSKNESEWPDAFRRGLHQVLRRVMRTEDFAAVTGRSGPAKPESFLTQFEYVQTSRGGQPILRMDFDADRVRDVLRKRGIEVWGSERPDVLVWIVIEDSQQSQLFSPELRPDLDRSLRELAGEAGLPIVTPLADLTDQQALPASDIVMGNEPRIREAAARYETQVILAGRLAVKSERDVQADWRLFLGPQQESWQAKAGDLREALNSGIAGTYTRLAAWSIPRSGDLATLELRITGIDSLDDANRVAAYLGKLSPVAQVEWLAIGTGDASFRVNVRGGREALDRALALGDLLRPAELEQDSAALIYRLAR
jgi:hypothetical protein